MEFFSSLLKSVAKLDRRASISWDCPCTFAFNPFVHNNISFADVGVRHDQFDLSRIEKCEFLANYCKKNKVEKPFIRACFTGKNGLNCCACMKCCKTLISFFAEEDYQEYGFPVPKDQAIKYIRNCIENDYLPYQQVWHLESIQKRLQERMAEGEQIPQNLLWFLSANVGKNIWDPRKIKETVNWRQLRDEFPDTPNIEPKLNDVSFGVIKMFSLRGSYRT